MSASWPSTVNQNMIGGTYRETPERNVVTFKPEVGTSKDRRRSSVPSEKVQFDSLLTKAERDDLKTFYRDDLEDGVLEFTRKNPKTGDTITCKFDGDLPFRDGGTGRFVVTLTLQLLP